MLKSEQPNFASPDLSGDEFAGFWGAALVVGIAAGVTGGLLMKLLRVVQYAACSPSRETPYIEHANLSAFKVELIETLKLVRSAILYFVEMIAHEEQRKAASPGLRVPIQVPHHHEIRGKDKEFCIKCPSHFRGSIPLGKKSEVFR